MGQTRIWGGGTSFKATTWKIKEDVGG